MKYAKGYDITSEAIEIVYSEEDTSQKNGVQIKRYDMLVHFLGTDGEVKTRDFNLYAPYPENPGGCPLIMNVHYPAGPSNPLSHEYLKRGWALLSPLNLPNNIGFPKGRSGLAGDDLRYNMAMLDLTRRLKFVDPERIALKGGSAGGYQMLMLSITHFGIICGHDLSGIANLAYEFKYMTENNKLNDEYEKDPGKFSCLYGNEPAARYVKTDIEHALPQDQDPEYSHYPIPRIKVAGMNHFVPSVTGTLDAGDPENEKWHAFSPVCHIDKLCHPLVVSHSTADVTVPLFQVTEKNAYQNVGPDFPAGYKYHLRELMTSERLNKPLDELFPEAEVETYVLNPYKGRYDNMLLFSPDKRLSINLIEEWKPERTFGHFRDRTMVDVSDLNFMAYYFEQTAALTNRLTLSKLEGLAQRYMGKLQLLEEENPYKPAQPPEIFGSLYSDRLDVLLNLAAYLGINIQAASKNPGQSASKNIAGYSIKNVETLISTYKKLDLDLRFFESDPAMEGGAFINEPLECILKGIRYYAKACNEPDLL